MALELSWVLVGSPEWEQARIIRNEELLRPIGLADFSREADDAASEHLVAVEGDRVVGTVLLVSGEPAKLRQMAVASSHQQRGIGRRLVQGLLERAKASGRREVVCHARAPVTGFYESLGFVCEGEPFEEVGIEHRFMRWTAGS